MVSALVPTNATRACGPEPALSVCHFLLAERGYFATEPMYESRR